MLLFYLFKIDLEESTFGEENNNSKRIQKSKPCGDLRYKRRYEKRLELLGDTPYSIKIKREFM